MSEKISISEALEVCGFVAGDRQESRLMALLSVILKLQEEKAAPLTFGEIYNQLLKDEPGSKLTKAWVHRVLKSLVEIQMVRLESPTSRRKRYIADVNTVMAGLEQLKSERIKELDVQRAEIDETLNLVRKLECGDLAQQFVESVTGSQQKISSRIVRGVEELHRVLKYNMLDVAKKGDTIRANLLWVGPFLVGDTIQRMISFIEAAKRGADVRYLTSTDVFRVEELTNIQFDEAAAAVLFKQLIELKKGKTKFDLRIYDGPKTYFQVSLNTDNMALVIADNPLTATWITRDFNPDLIDNAVKAFDREWKKAKSFLDLTPQDLRALGVEPDALISRIRYPNSQEQKD